MMKRCIYSITAPLKSEQTMADIYIHKVTDISLNNTILPTNSTHLSTLTITNNQGQTSINIFFDTGTKYNWKHMTALSVEEHKDDQE